MVFLVAAVAQSGSDLGGGPASPFSRGGPTAAQPAAPQSAERGAAPAELKVATAAPAPAAAPVAAATAAATAVADQRAQETATAFSTNSGSPQDAAARELSSAERTSLGLSTPAPSPLIWLGLSLIAAIVAFTAHWRLRAA
jgi:hypothetical protein